MLWTNPKSEARIRLHEPALADALAGASGVDSRQCWPPADLRSVAVMVWLGGRGIGPRHTLAEETFFGPHRVPQRSRIPCRKPQARNRTSNSPADQALGRGERMTLAEASDRASESDALSNDYYTHLRADLDRAVRRICPTWLGNRSEDIVQSALIRVCGLREGKEKPPELAPSYLRRVAYSALVDEIRKLRWQRQEVSLPEEETPLAETHDPGPERKMASREIGLGILDCLRHLKKARRLAVTLYLQGHTVPEAAAILGWSRKAIENLVYRGLSNLRHCLTAKGLTP